MTPILELQDVCFSYHSKSGETYALSDLSFQVFPSEFIAVTGPSGCGKSTLLSLISGLLTPVSGSILLQGQTNNKQNLISQAGKSRTNKSQTDKNRTDKSRIGYMLQKDHLLEWRTIYRNVTLGLEIQHRLDEDTRARVDQMLKDYGLWQFRNALPSELSGGMRQRAALIRTLAPDPELLLLDEPFSALDYQTRLHLCDEVSAIIRREKKTAILVTHDLSEAISMADRVIVLSARPARIRAILELHFAQDGALQAPCRTAKIPDEAQQTIESYTDDNPADESKQTITSHADDNPADESMLTITSHADDNLSRDTRQTRSTPAADTLPSENRQVHTTRPVAAAVETSAPHRLTPFERRSAPEFQNYFNLLWKELNEDETKKQG